MTQKKTLTSLLLQYKYSILVGLLTLTFVDACQLVIPLIIERAVDALTIKGDGYGHITKYALYIVGLATIMSVFRFFWRYFLLGASRRIELKLRNDFFSHLQSLSFDFFAEKKTGDLMAHTVNDIEAIKMACGIGVIIAYDGIFLLVFILAAMIYVSPELTLYAFIPFPILCFFIFKFGQEIEKRFEGVQASFSDLTESARESISGIKMIKAAVKEKTKINDFDTDSKKYKDSNLNLIRIWGVYQPLITFIASTGTAIFLWLGGRSTITGHITLGDFVAILLYIGMLTWPMTAMAWAVDMIKRGNASLNRVNDILLTKPNTGDSSNASDVNIEGNIEIKHLSFSYNGHRVLRGIDLSISKGKALGITGNTGSGKSTLLKLLMRIEEPAHGQIFVDGHDVTEIRRESLRNGIVFIPQETTVFSGTVRDNISFMNPKLTEEQIIEAAKSAQIYDEILEFPGGLDARIGERGLTLSGGQRQRVAIARAILLNPKVLILDDVLSSLDLKTENLVLKGLRRIMQGRTLIFVSSRVPSISGFDKIAVFEDGKIIEIGNHEELIANDGLYSRLYHVQAFEQ